MTPIKSTSDSISELCTYTKYCLDEVKMYNDAIGTSAETLSLDSLHAIKLKTQVEQKAQLDFIQSQTKDLLSRVDQAAYPRILEISLLFGQIQVQRDKLASTLDSLIGLSERDSYLAALEEGLRKLREGPEEDRALVYEELQKGINYLESIRSEFTGLQGFHFSLIKDALAEYLDSVVHESAAAADVEMAKGPAPAKKSKFLHVLETMMKGIPQEGPLNPEHKSKFLLAFSSDAYIDFTYALNETHHLSPKDKLRLRNLQKRIAHAYMQAVVK